MRPRSHRSVGRESATITLQNRKTLRLRTVVVEVESGGVTAAVRLAAFEFPIEQWRCLCISTMASVLSDLRGRRPINGKVVTPERMLLTRLGLVGWLE